MSLLLTLTVMSASAALIVAATHQSRVSERMMAQRVHSGAKHI